MSSKSVKFRLPLIGHKLSLSLGHVLFEIDDNKLSRDGGSELNYNTLHEHTYGEILMIVSKRGTSNLGFRKLEVLR